MLLWYLPLLLLPVSFRPLLSRDRYRGFRLLPPTVLRRLVLYGMQSRLRSGNALQAIAVIYAALSDAPTEAGRRGLAGHTIDLPTRLTPVAVTGRCVS